MFRCFLTVALAAATAAVPQAAFTAEFAVHAITIPEMKAVFGQVESRTVVPARARIGGTIREIRVSEGSEVREGDVIGVVVDDKIALQLAAADAKIAALKSEFANARTELERAEQLVAQGVATQSRLDAARTALEVATNQVAAAEADKAVIAQGAKEGDVLAPATGRVLTVPVTAGSVIMAGEPVARIATGPYYLRLSLPERHAAEIAEGAIVEVGVRGRAQASGAPGATAQGRIVKVYPEIADGRVIADVDVAGIGSYFVNERTLVSIPVGKRSVLAVPQKAVTSLHGIDYVRLAATDGPMDVAVILGETFESQSGTLVEILTGLKDGDRIMLP
ncbi:MAG: efflux RND transporter periplasmic adaptor subunit [Mesorhizobium sp.]|nr:efflux RND transporter periplasmic adaptor subunit [Mesorhizobium sp.]MBN9245156.1 efflux RND transporter periplasmic adaptor subunit [Mesorhizobium sp.]